MGSCLGNNKRQQARLRRMTNNILIDIEIQGEQKLFTMHFRPNIMIQSIKEKIAEHMGCQNNQVDIFFGTQKMYDDHNLQLYCKNHEWIKIKAHKHDNKQKRTMTLTNHSSNPGTVLHYYQQSQVQIQIDFD